VRPLTRIVLVLVLVLTPTGTALAATKEKTVVAAGLHFKLHGRALTVTVVAQPGHNPPDRRARLLGRRVTVGCFTQFADKRGALVWDTARWPADALRYTFHFRFDISRDAHQCLLVQGGPLNGGAYVVATAFFPKRK
jgi:hypothetical protein